MKEIVYVDFLNIASFFKLAKNERGSNVTYLFRSKSRVLENLLIKILTIFGVRCKFDKMDFNKVKFNPSTKIIDNINSISSSIVDVYGCNISSKVGMFFDYSLGMSISESLWRQCSITEYLKQLDVRTGSVYISTVVNYKVLKNIGLCADNIIYYKSIGLFEDSGYAGGRRLARIKFFGNTVGIFIEYIYLLVRVKLKRKVFGKKIDILIFSHKEKLKWIGIDNISNYLSARCKIVRQNGLVEYGVDSFQLMSTHWKNIIKYYLHIIRGIRMFYRVSDIGFNYFFVLLEDWKKIFFLKEVFCEYEVKAILSGYESNLSQLAVALSSDSDDMVSFDCVWSIGEYPSKFVPTSFKFADRSFIWGMWHYELMLASDSRSSGYVISGYVGDCFVSKMKNKGESVFLKSDKNYDKLITIFDVGGYTLDYLYTKENVEQFIKCILDVAVEFDALVVIKTKKNMLEVQDEDPFNNKHEIPSLYKNLINKYGKDRMVFLYESSSLISALRSDVVIGMSSSTLASVSSVHGIPSIMYDPSKVVWSKWNLGISAYNLAYTLEKVDSLLRSILRKDKTEDNFITEYIDPFADGKSQMRMAKYIEDTLYSLTNKKDKPLIYADKRYISKWGVDKIM